MITMFQKISNSTFTDLIYLPYPLFREIQENRLKIEEEIKKKMEEQMNVETKTFTTGMQTHL